MILTCPSCRARYVVPDSAIGIGGRKVRCAQCRFSWFQEGPDELPPAPPVRRAPPPQPAARVERPAPRPAREVPPPPPPPPVEREPEPEHGYAVEPVQDYAPEPEPMDWAPAEHEEEPRRRYRRNPARLWTILAVVAALLMVGALAAVYFVGPQQFAAWMGGGEVDGAERLRFTRRDVTREPLPTDKELLTVTGEITNVSGQVQRVPQIRADVTDADQRIIFSWTIAPPVRDLQPGQTASFSSASTDVPKGGRNLNLSFGPTT